MLRIFLQEFGSFERTLQTEFEMLFGGFSENWANDPMLPRELQVVPIIRGLETPSPFMALAV
jgi:hypothetical protein